MIYSKSRQQYDALYEDLKKMKVSSVLDYFETQWNICVNEWTMFGRNMNNYFLNTTSNRVESLNQKIKLVVTKYSNMIRFFKDLNVSINVRASEKDMMVIKNTMKKICENETNSVLIKYKEYLTNFAFRKVAEKFHKKDDVKFSRNVENTSFFMKNNVEFETQNNKCGCNFFVQWHYHVNTFLN